MDTQTIPEILWHYTTGHNLVRIIEAGKILLAPTLMPTTQRSAVWFSFRTDWEPTANQILVRDGWVRRASLKEMVQENGFLARLGVRPSTASVDWDAYKKESGVSRKMAEALDAAGRTYGADPKHWHVSFDAVPIEDV